MAICTRCNREMTTGASCDCRFDEDVFELDELVDDGDIGVHWRDRVEPFGVDFDGDPIGRVVVGGHEVIVHYGDVPDSDLTVVRGIPCTTAVRTVIDCASHVSIGDLRLMVDDAVARGLFTLDEMWHRLDQPDMATRPSAELVRRAMPPRP